MLKSNSAAFSQPSGTSGITGVRVSVVKVKAPVANTRIYAVSTPATLSAYCSNALAIIAAPIVSVRLYEPSTVNCLDAVNDTGQVGDTSTSTSTASDDGLTKLTTRLFSILSSALVATLYQASLLASNVIDNGNEGSIKIASKQALSAGSASIVIYA